jgi:curved DNA-binding protein
LEFKDYYGTLGVARGAGADSIKAAYRKLARKYHPDVSREPDAAERMKEVNEAWAVLGDPAKRAAYDRLGSGPQPGEEFRPPPGWDEGFEFGGRGFSPEEASGFSEFFSEIFGRMAGAGRGAAGGFTRAHAGDSHARILLDLEDSFTGPTRQITLETPRLDEQGRVTLETRTLQVRIPQGVRAGQMIRLAGQGAALRGERNPGDLLLEIGFRPHPRLHPEGRDLHTTLPVAPWEAALGAVVPVELPGGTVKVRIPPGAEPGRRLRVRGKGLPADPPGDLYLDVRIVAPPARTPRERELWEALRAEARFDPRGNPGAGQ